MPNQEKYLPIERNTRLDQEKYLPIDRSLVSDTSEEELDKEKEEKKIDSEKALKRARKDIEDYFYQSEGEGSETASFHVDHDAGKFVEIKEEEEHGDSSLLNNAPKEEDFADLGIAGDRKINGLSKALYGPERTGGRKDNLKTWPERKRERASRGLIRDFLHDLWHKD